MDRPGDLRAASREDGDGRFALRFIDALSQATITALEAASLVGPDSVATALQEEPDVTWERLRRLAVGGASGPRVVDDLTVISAALRLPIRVHVDAGDGAHGISGAGDLPGTAAGDAVAARLDLLGCLDPASIAEVCDRDEGWAEDLLDRLEDGCASLDDVLLLAAASGLTLTASVTTVDARGGRAIFLVGPDSRASRADGTR